MLKIVDDYSSVKFESISCKTLENDVRKSKENAFIFFGPKSFVASDGPLGKLTHFLLMDKLNPEFTGNQSLKKFY
jgi:hypothetical protein